MPQPTVHSYLVEHYRPGLGVPELDTAVTDIRDQFRNQQEHGSSSRFLGSVIVASDEAFLVVVLAESELEVREVYRRAGATFDRITVAITDLATPSPSPPGSSAAVDRHSPGSTHQ